MAAGKIFAISFAINAMMGGSFGTAMSQASAAMRRLDERTRELNAEQKRLDGAWNQSQAAVRAYQSNIQSLKSQLDAGKISQSQYDMAVRRAGDAMRASSMSVEDYRAHLARLRQEAAQTQAKLEQFKAATAAKNQAAANFSAAKAGLMETVGTVGMFAAPLVASIQTAANFEAAMSKVQAITRANSEEIKSLTDNARMLGETTQFSATQAADAMSYLGMAGWNSQQIIAGMPGLLALAAAGGTDLARAADIVSDDLTAFGLSAENAAHMADVFAVTATRTNTNVEMIGETMKYAAPVAKAFGASMEETAALTGIMANAGVKASQAGTSLRAGFLRLAGPPKKSAKAMQELGISLSDLSAQQAEASAALKSLGIDMENIGGTPSHKMVAVLQELKDKTAGLSSEEKLATLQIIFGTEAATGWLNVLEAGPDVFESLVKEMENCDGEAQKMAAVMMNNAKGAWTQFKSAVEGVGISVGSIFLPSITAATQNAAALAGGFSQFVKQHEGLVMMAGSFAAAAAGAMLLAQGYKVVRFALQYLFASLKLYYTGLQEIGKAGQALIPKLASIKTAVMSNARAMAIINTVASGETYKRLGQSAMQAYSQLRAITWAQIGMAMKNGITSGVSGAKNGLSAFKTNAILAMSQARQAVVAGTANIIASAGNASRAVITMIRSFSLAGALQTAANGFRSLGTAIMSVGRAGLAAMFSPLGIAIMAIAGAAYLVYANWESVGPFFLGLWQQIQAAFANGWAMIQPALTQLQEAFATMMEALGPVMVTLGAAFTDAFNQISMAISTNSGVFDVLVQALTFLAEILGGVLIGAFILFANVAVGAITMAVGVISSLITGMLGVLTGLIEFVTGVFTGNWSAAWQGVVDIFSSIFSTIGNIANSVLNGIQSTVNGIINSVKGVANILPGAGGGGGGTPIAHNARGGIYAKGAFLTTFAEEGPEAAIPLDGSPRAIALWQTAGEMLGIGNGQNTAQEMNAYPKAPVLWQTAGEMLGIGNGQNTAQEMNAYPKAPGLWEKARNIFGGSTGRNTASLAPIEMLMGTRTDTAPVNAPPISITLNFTGNFEPDAIRKAVEKAGQAVQRSFAEEMEKYNMERRRLSFG